MQRKKVLTALLVALALAASACGAGSDPGDDAQHAGGHGAGSDQSGSDEYSFGRPAGASDADRTITVAGTDEPRFEPDHIEIEAGQTIAFEFVNEGKGPHEFVFGDASAVAELGEGHAGHASAPNATDEVDPGGTQTIAWTFTEAGEFVYECHVDAHHKQGMRGTIRVK